jgi:MFS family permease
MTSGAPTRVEDDHSAAAPAQPQRNKPAKVAVAALIGTSIEWYDYGIYGFCAAVVFPTVFVPEMPTAVATLASFATLAVGSLGRPLGAAIFGHIGDRYGRKPSLVISLMIMGIMTVAIGLLPGYAAIGIAAPILLLLIRIVQSLAVGGEWGGALLFAVEAAPPRQRALFGSFTQMGSGVGYFLSSGAFALIALFGDQAVLSWAWRLPFLASAVLIAAGLLIRMQLSETEEFQHAKHDTEDRGIPLVALLRTQWRRVLLGIGAFVVPIGGFYIIVSFVSAYASSNLRMSTGDIATAGLVASAVSIVLTPITALFADRFGVRRVTVVGLVLHVVVAYPMFLLLDAGTPLGLNLAMCLGMIASTIAYAPIGTLVAGWFQPTVRQSGVSIAYQVSGVIGGGLIPVLAQQLSIATGGGWTLVAGLLVVLSLISLVSVLLVRGRTYLQFRGENVNAKETASDA